MSDWVRNEPCELCGAAAIVVINGFGYCIDHVDEGMRRTMRLISMIREVPVEVVEHEVSELLRELIPKEASDDD
jgi:hypothetical protein